LAAMAATIRLSERTLSIIIPVRNGAATLPTLLDALERQLPVPGWQIEVIAGLAPSTDDTARILQERAVKIAPCDRLGPSAARNAGARIATGSLFYFIDADAAPVGDDFLRRLVGIAQRLRRAGRLGALGGPILLDPSQQTNPVAVADHFACWFNWNETRPSQRTGLFQPTVSLVMPRDVYLKLGGFDEKIYVLEDFDLQARMTARGLRLYYVNQLRVTHRARGTLLKSWRHSWGWGLPYRGNYMAKAGAKNLRFPLQSRLFFLNFPFLFVRRMQLVMRAARRVSSRQALLTSPLIAATVFACVLAMVVGKYEPTDKGPA